VVAENHSTNTTARVANPIRTLRGTTTSLLM
jgi:hypothetical protein